MPERVVPTSPFATTCAYAYLLRVQLLIVLAMWGLPFLGFGPWDTPRSLLQNLFITTPYGLFLSTLTALLVGWSLLLTSRLVLLNGSDRFGVTQWWTTNTLKLKVFATAGAVAAPIVGTQLWAWSSLHRSAESAPVWSLIGAVAGGVAVAYLVAYAGLLLAVAMAPVGTHEAAQTFPAKAFLRKWLDRANHVGLPGVIADPLKRFFAALPEDLWAGYIDRRKAFDDPPFPGPNPGYQLPWSGHFVSLTFAVMTLVVYWSIGAYRTSHVGESTDIPALVFIMLLLLIANWWASLLTFFFDRFRVPLLIPALLVALFTSWYSADHVFTTITAAPAEQLWPAAVVDSRANVGGPIIVVATAGGGIQSAAWTAQVLTGLEEQFSGPAVQPAFSSRIALVSAVSGGAVGSMFFLNEYRAAKVAGGFAPASSLAAIVQHAEAGALDDVAWSLAYNDVPRIFTSRSAADPLLDRGKVLEDYWRRQAGISANMGDWRNGVKDGWRPAVIFNSTIAETGEPLLFSTTDFPDPAAAASTPSLKRDLPVRQSFQKLYVGLDLPVVTAVRLASSFPYVSPAARANGSTEKSHLVDGGYYDNYGVASAIDWIDSALHAYPQGQGPDVLFILIKSFPDNALPTAEEHGWFFQTYAPIQGLFNVRTTTQLVRDRFELLQLRDRLGRDAHGAPKLRFATFQFPEDTAPLSWRMNDRQIDAIAQRWRTFVDAEKNLQRAGDDLVQVKCALLGVSASSRCMTVLNKDPW